MSYTCDTGEISARYRPLVEIPDLVMTSGTRARFTAPGSATNHQFGLFEWNMPAGSGGPDAHFHKTFSESFYIIDGTVRLYNGERWVDATAGDFLYVPEGGIHAFRNDSAEPARMLILFSPGAPREKYFQELYEIGRTGRKLSDEEWIDLYARHDQFPAE